jgi:NitT/TauT family transport system permease protein
MVIAFIFSVVFAFFYGYYAATNKFGEKILIPVLDVLQSIPVLGFFPAAIAFFILFLNGSSVGVELAAIFLIFTSMAWNIAFAVYESIKTVPRELCDVTRLAGLNSWQRFLKLYLPASIPKVVYNGILSWSAGWYFLVACEMISLGSKTYTLPGIGSFLVQTAARADLTGLFLGLVFLFTIIFIFFTLVWQPLSVWSEKFKYEEISYSTQQTIWNSFFKSFPLMVQIKGKATELLEKTYHSLYNATNLFRTVYFKHIEKAIPLIKRIIFYMIMITALYFLIQLILFFSNIFSYSLPVQAASIPMDLLLSFIRLTVAFIITCAITIPIGIYVGLKGSKKILYIFETFSAIPATALFPVIILIISSFAGFEISVIVLILTGMMWYVFFNVVAGVSSIPQDLKDLQKIFNLNPQQYLQKIVIPAMTPSFITGSITAFGGGWNALIVAEYINFGGKILQVQGIGSLIDYSVYSTNNVKILALSLLAMTTFIIILNILVWKKLYKWAFRKYSMES